MSNIRRQLPVLISTMLVFLLLPAAAFAQQGGFGTDRQDVDGEGPEGVTVTDVQIASHDEFDRVTFEITGDGLAGWLVEYDDDPATQGEGAPVELAGDATLRVGVTNVVLPPDAPEGVEPFFDDLAGPQGGVITEIFNDSVFEGQHVFFVGVTEELPFRVQRLENPQRIVVDIAGDTPVDGVETGLGGTADTGVPFTTLAAGLTIAFAFALVAGGLLVRRRRS